MNSIIELDHYYTKYKELGIEKKYFPYSALKNVMKKHSLRKKPLGESYLGNIIYQITQGKGKKQILIWSQMHGNESTGTRAMFDVLNFLNSNEALATQINDTITIHFIPMLNPDGSNLYTRHCATGIDMNRDFIQESTPEIRILKQYVKDHSFEFLFNLHDQRTIFGVDNQANLPATISFLSPSFNKEETINDIRKDVMGLISEMNRNLQLLIRGQVGRYNHEFYPRSTGDNFTKLGNRCVLFEAGHHPKDYERNKTRKYNFIAIISALKFISENNYYSNNYKDYFTIPSNNQSYLDLIIRKVNISVNPEKTIITDIGIQYKDHLKNNQLIYNAEIVEIGDLNHKKGHEEIQGNQERFIVNQPLISHPKIGEIMKFTIGNYIRNLQKH